MITLQPVLVLKRPAVKSVIRILRRRALSVTENLSEERIEALTDLLQLGRIGLSNGTYFLKT